MDTYQPLTAQRFEICRGMMGRQSDVASVISLSLPHRAVGQLQYKNHHVDIRDCTKNITYLKSWCC